MADRRPWFRSLSKLGSCLKARRMKRSRGDKSEPSKPPSPPSPSPSELTYCSGPASDDSPETSQKSLVSPVEILMDTPPGREENDENTVPLKPSPVRSKTNVENSSPSLHLMNLEEHILSTAQPLNSSFTGRPPMVRRNVSAPNGSQRSVNFEMHPTTMIPSRGRVMTEDSSASLHRRLGPETFDNESLQAIHRDEPSIASEGPPCGEIDLTVPHLTYNWSNATGLSYQNCFDEDDNDSLQWSSDDEEVVVLLPPPPPPPSVSAPMISPTPMNSPEWMQNWAQAVTPTEKEETCSFVVLETDDEEELDFTYFCKEAPQDLVVSEEAEILCGWAAVSWTVDLAEDTDVDYSEHLWYVQATKNSTVVLVRSDEQQVFAFGSDVQFWTKSVSAATGSCVIIEDSHARLQILPVPCKGGQLEQWKQSRYAPKAQNTAAMHARFCLDACWRHYHEQPNL